MGVANSCTVRFPNWLPNNLEVPYERKIKASRIRMDNTTRSCADDVVAFDVMGMYNASVLLVGCELFLNSITCIDLPAG